MPNTIRTPRRGVTAGSRRIAEAVDNEEWQKFRVSLKGLSTVQKIAKLEWYWFDYYLHSDEVPRDMRDWHGESFDITCDVCVRIDNYIKALARGGQLWAGESLQTMLMQDWNPKIKK
jgi:hypothetical protein